MSRYRDQLKEGRKWALVEAGYSEDLTAELKKIALEKADQLFEEFKMELMDIEEEEEDNFNHQERKFERLRKNEGVSRPDKRKFERKSRRNYGDVA